jgi:DNA-binding Lrp family transcriptional regulator
LRELDRIDCDILAALQKNARLSNKELAARLGIAQSTCLERVRRMLEEGILRGFHARLDPHLVGIGLQALIAIRLSRHSRDLVEAFRAHALAVPEVVALYHVTGANDFLLHVAVRDADHLRDLALTAFSGRSEVIHIETSLLFEHVPKHRWPVYCGVPGEE